jgi:HTH-type transcriptional regulator/antitoxin HigA
MEIKTEEQYQEALNRLEEIFDAKSGTEEGDELELLSVLIEKYENEKYPIDSIKFRVEQSKQKD